MATTYYKYAERSADANLNWFEISKNMTDMLGEVNRVREEKKAAYDQAARQLENNLMEAPQGKDQDINDFTNDYAHLAINQMTADVKAFKSGMLKERDYTLKMQNYMDGTKQLFELSKLYQDEYSTKMEGVLSGKLQAMNVFNLTMAEGYADFDKSKAVINPLTGKVGIGLVETEIIDGKEVNVVSKNIAPVNVIRGKILQSIPTFDVDAKTTQTVKGFGTRKDILYEHATLNNAGSITEYMGPTFLSTLKDPTDIKVVEDMHKAIDDQVASYFSNPYNLSSVLTENLGKYNAESFTFDKAVADADPNKVLVKIDPNTKMTTLDDKGKNYKSQKQEAADWVKSDILRKMDEERSIKTTPQNQLQETAEQKERAAFKYRVKPADETPKPIEVGEILSLTTTDSKGVKKQVGVTQRIENLVFSEGKGIENVATSISYNAKNGTLELSGYQISGKEESGSTTPGEKGVVGKEGTTVVKKKNFVKNDVNNAPLLSTMVLKIPNPERPGYNFSGIKEAKSYYRRKFEGQAGQRPIQFDAKGNIIQ